VFLKLFDHTNTPVTASAKCFSKIIK